MAKTGYIDPNLVDIDSFYKYLRSAERFTFSRIVAKKVFLSREKISFWASLFSFFSQSPMWLIFTVENPWRQAVVFTLWCI